jgi:hypothetical protein
LFSYHHKKEESQRQHQHYAIIAVRVSTSATNTSGIVAGRRTASFPSVPNKGCRSSAQTFYKGAKPIIIVREG